MAMNEVIGGGMVHPILGPIRWRFDWNPARDVRKIEMERLGGAGYCVRSGWPTITEDELVQLGIATLIGYLHLGQP